MKLRLFVFWALVALGIAWDYSASRHSGGDPYAWDYSCFWAGARVALSDPAALYNFARVTAEQGSLIHGPDPRPFIYPPSSLPIFLWLGFLPHWVGYAAWLVVGFGVYLFAAARLRLSPVGWALLLTMPPVVLVAASGQVTALMAGLAILGLVNLDRPRLAGVLFGLVCATKPQLMLLLPLALLADRRWAVACWVGLTICAAVAVSFLFGPMRWVEWLEALRPFNAVVSQPSYMRFMLTPTAAALNLGLSGRLLHLWQLAFALLGGWLVWRTFRATDDPAQRSIALFVGALLVTPYGLNYELALLAPGLAALVSRTGEKGWASKAAAVPFLQIAGFGVGFPGLLATAGLALADVFKAPAQTECKGFRDRLAHES